MPSPHSVEAKKAYFESDELYDLAKSAPRLMAAFGVSQSEILTLKPQLDATIDTEGLRNTVPMIAGLRAIDKFDAKQNFKRYFVFLRLLCLSKYPPQINYWHGTPTPISQQEHDSADKLTIRMLKTREFREEFYGFAEKYGFLAPLHFLLTSNRTVAPEGAGEFLEKWCADKGIDLEQLKVDYEIPDGDYVLPRPDSVEPEADTSIDLANIVAGLRYSSGAPAEKKNISANKALVTDGEVSFQYDISDEFRLKLLDLYERASNAQDGKEMAAIHKEHDRLHQFDETTNLDNKGPNTLIQLDKLWEQGRSTPESDASHMMSIIFLDSFKLSNDYISQKTLIEGRRLEEVIGKENAERMGKAKTKKFYEELSNDQLYRLFERMHQHGILGIFENHLANKDVHFLPSFLSKKLEWWKENKMPVLKAGPALLGAGQEKNDPEPENADAIIAEKQEWFDQHGLAVKARRLGGEQFALACGLEHYDPSQSDKISKRIHAYGSTVIGSLRAIATIDADFQHKRSHLFAEMLNLSKISAPTMKAISKKIKKASALGNSQLVAEAIQYPAYISWTEGGHWSSMLNDQGMSEEVFGHVKNFDLVAPFYFLLSSKNTHAPRHVADDFKDWCQKEGINLRQALLDYELIDLNKPKPDIDLEMSLASQLIEYGISTGSKERNARLSGLSMEELHEVPQGERDHAWYAHMVRKSPGYIGDKTVVDALTKFVRETSASDVTKERFGQAISQEAGLSAPPVPAMWIESDVDDDDIAKIAFLLERLPKNKTGLKVTQFVLHREHGMLPKEGQAIFHSVTIPVPSNKLATIVYKYNVSVLPETEEELAFVRSTAQMVHFVAAINDTSQPFKFLPPPEGATADIQNKPLGTITLNGPSITLNMKRAAHIPGINAPALLPTVDESPEKTEPATPPSPDAPVFTPVIEGFAPSQAANDGIEAERVSRKFRLKAIEPNGIPLSERDIWWPNPEGRDLDHAVVRKNINAARLNRASGAYKAFNEPAHHYPRIISSPSDAPDGAEKEPANDTSVTKETTHRNEESGEQASGTRERESPAVFAGLTKVPDIEESTLFPDSLTDDEKIEIWDKYEQAYRKTVEVLLSEADMYLFQALNRGCNQFSCFIDLNKPGFAIHLRFSGEVEIEGETKTRTHSFILENYDKVYRDLGIPLTMENAVDLKIAVQSIILNTEGVFPARHVSFIGKNTSVKYDTQMPSPMKGFEPAIRTDTRGMCSLTYAVQDPYNKGLVRVSVPLGMAMHFEDEAAEQTELRERKEFVLGYLRKIEEYRTSEGFRAYVFKRDVMAKLKSWLKENNKEWETSERVDLEGFESSRLIHVFSQNAQPSNSDAEKNITLASISLGMDVGGENASWNCYLNFYMGDQGSKLMGERVHTRFFSLRTRDPQLAIARALETLNGVGNKFDGICEGLIPTLQRHARENGDGWRVEKTDKGYKVYIGGGLELQDALDDMMRYERDIGVKLEQILQTYDGNTIITLQALRCLIGDLGGAVRPAPEYVYERDEKSRKPIALSVQVPREKVGLIDSFVDEVDSHIKWFAEEAYGSIAIGQKEQPDRRKRPLEYRTVQIRNGLIRAVEAIYESHFGYKLPKNWYRPEMQYAILQNTTRQEENFPRKEV